MMERTSQNIKVILILLSGLILIVLNIYTFVKSDIPDEHRKYILYTEIPLSFIASYVILLFMSYIIIDYTRRYVNLLKNPFGFFAALLVILSSPFSLTIVKSVIQSVIQNKESDKYLSIPIIIITFCTMFFTFMAANGK